MLCYINPSRGCRWFRFGRSLTLPPRFGRSLTLPLHFYVSPNFFTHIPNRTRR